MKKFIKQHGFLIGGGILVVGFAIFFVWNYFEIKSVAKQNEHIVFQDFEVGRYQNLLPNLPSQSELEKIINDEAKKGEDWIGKYEELREIRQYYNEDNKNKLNISWYKGARALEKQETKDLWSKVDPDGSIKKMIIGEDCVEKGRCDIHIFEAGKLAAKNDLNGQLVYYLFTPNFNLNGPFLRHMVIFDKERKTFVELSFGDIVRGWMDYLYSGNNTDNGYKYSYIKGQILTDKELINTIPEAPKYLDIPGSDGKLAYQETASGLSFDSGIYDNAGGIISVAEHKVLKTPDEKSIFFIDKTYGPVYKIDGYFLVMMADGRGYKYDYVPYFLQIPQDGEDKEMYSLGYKANIKWSVDIASSEEFTLSGDIGRIACSSGFLNCTNVVNDKSWFNEKNLVEIGKTTKGESVYELKDKASNSYYKQFYDWGTSGWNNEEGRSYTEAEIAQNAKDFFNGHPLFFWKDESGDWRSYRNIGYQPTAECGKPVIYLYPEKTMDINVQVKPNGGFSKTEPVYLDGGWQVRATPSSEIFNYSDNLSYPYLFWEGKAYDYQVPDYGFAMSKDEVAIKMPKILGNLGLNQKEVANFMEFWQKKLEVKPYVFVTFLPQSEFDKLAPLNIQPKPDKVIRVFMDYTPLDKPIAVNEPLLRSPQRTGFTVVEWGGRLK